MLALLSTLVAVGGGLKYNRKLNAQNFWGGKRPNLVFGLGDDGDEVMRTAKVPISKSRISTALMYDASKITTGVEPVFQFTGRHGIAFPQATDVEFMSDTEEGGKVRTIQVTFKLPVSPKDVRDAQAFEVYDRDMHRYVMNVVSIINVAGYKRFIDLSSPRIGGRSTYAVEPKGYGGASYASSQQIVWADPNSKLSLDDWKHLPRGWDVIWDWYADGVFIELKYTRDHRSANLPIVLGDQLFLTIQTESSWLDVYGPTYDSAREKYEREIPKLLRQRALEESKARAMGAHILTDWVDPVIAGVFPPKH